VATQEQVYSGVVGIETVQTILARSAMEADLEVVAYLECFLYGKNIENTMIKAGWVWRTSRPICHCRRWLVRPYNGYRNLTKGRTGISRKVKWDENVESFQSYQRLIIDHCQQHELGYLLIPHFMKMYIRHGTSVLE
jgi:hypothetical protein